MAAYFKNGDGRWIEWHIGEPIPKIVLTWKVVTIQADGDELTAILEDMESLCAIAAESATEERDGNRLAQYS